MYNSWQPRQYGSRKEGIDMNRKCNTLWIGDLELEVDEKYLFDVFDKDYKVLSIHVYKDRLTNGKVTLTRSIMPSLSSKTQKWQRTP